jgi:hypothetical protein
MSSQNDKIQITWDDLDAVPASEPAAPVTPAAGPVEVAGSRSWGSIATPENTAEQETSKGSLMLKGWFYLGTAGFFGALLAWMICEPTFYDSERLGFGSFFLFPMMVILMCVGFGTAESIVERSWTRALNRGLASIGLGLFMGFAFSVIAGLLFQTFVTMVINSGANPDNLAANPFVWLARALAWAIFGMAGGLVFGIVSKSSKKIQYGMLGGVIGAGLGGLVFDPISLFTGDGAELSRVIGMTAVGAFTGMAIGLVESALKDQWLYVASGPLAGKQFILYQNEVTIGKDQAREIYLFKDPDILDHHATIEKKNGRSVLTAFGPVIVTGQILQGGQQHTLQNGEYIQIGRYAMSYAEKERTVNSS